MQTTRNILDFQLTIEKPVLIERPIDLDRRTSPNDLPTI
jgi:hypothetical protein